MFVVVDHRSEVTENYVTTFADEGFSALGFDSGGLGKWLKTVSQEDLGAVKGFMLGDDPDRTTLLSTIRSRCRAPIIGLSEERSLKLVVELFTAGIDDVVRKPVHVKELVVRANAVQRRGNQCLRHAGSADFKVYFDGRDPEINGERLSLPRRERQILEHLAKNAHRRVTKSQIFDVVYGIFDAHVDEQVIEAHVSKIRKKLRLRLGREVIDAKRFVGYQFIG
jgi:two-component system, OmpR family, flagellar system response regulator FtcR